jgi:predicted DNA-binding protein
MVYKFSLPPELMGRMVAIRKRTKKSLAQQVREAVSQYCDRMEKELKKSSNFK